MNDERIQKILNDVSPELKYLARQQIEQEEREQREQSRLTDENRPFDNNFPVGSLEYDLKERRRQDLMQK